MIKDDGDNEKDDGDQWRLLGVAAYEDEYDGNDVMMISSCYMQLDP